MFPWLKLFGSLSDSVAPFLKLIRTVWVTLSLKFRGKVAQALYLIHSERGISWQKFVRSPEISTWQVNFVKTECYKALRAFIHPENTRKYPVFWCFQGGKEPVILWNHTVFSKFTDQSNSENFFFFHDNTLLRWLSVSMGEGITLIFSLATLQTLNQYGWFECMMWWYCEKLRYLLK